MECFGGCQKTKLSGASASFELVISERQQQLPTVEKKLPNLIGTKVESSWNRVHRMWQHKVHTWVIITTAAKKRLCCKGLKGLTISDEGGRGGQSNADHC